MPPLTHPARRAQPGTGAAWIMLRASSAPLPMGRVQPLLFEPSSVTPGSGGARDVGHAAAPRGRGDRDCRSASFGVARVWVGARTMMTRRGKSV